MGPREAAAVAGMVGIGSVVGRFVGGYLLDRIHGTVVGGVVLAIPIFVLAILLNSGSLELGSNKAIAGVTAFMLGLALGSETDIVAYLASRYLGLRHFGFVYGSLIGFMSLGTGLGPMLGGAIYDRFGSYRPFELLLCLTFALAVLMITTLGPYPSFETVSDPSADRDDGSAA